MDKMRFIFYIAALSLIAACSKTSVPVSDVDSNEIVAFIEDSHLNTKCTLDGTRPSFSPGDELKVVDFVNASNKGRYIYKSKQSVGGSVEYTFQSRYGQAVDFTQLNMAFYPYSWFVRYTYKGGKKIVTVEFPENQSCTYFNDTQIISAPMACFSPESSSKLNFSNISCILKVGIKCKPEPESEIYISQIVVTSEDENNLSGLYTIKDDNSVESIGSLCETFVSLTNCENAGALSGEVKYFYIILPPVFDDKDYNEDKCKYIVDVYFVGGSHHSYTFMAQKDVSKILLTMNTIVDFETIEIDPATVL